MNNNFENSSNQEEQSFNLKNEISYYLFFWPWFFLTLAISLICSFFYLRYTPKVYSSSAQIQITKSDASSSFLTTEITSLFGTRVNVENDISVITSRSILNKVVRQLNLQTTVKLVGTIKSSLKYGKELPFEFKFKNLDKYQEWSLFLYKDASYITDGLTRFNINNNRSLDNDYFSFSINDSLALINSEYIVNNIPLNDAATLLNKRIVATPGSKNGEIINLSIAGTNKRRNDAILNTLIQIFIDDRILTNASFQMLVLSLLINV